MKQLCFAVVVLLILFFGCTEPSESDNTSNDELADESLINGNQQPQEKEIDLPVKLTYTIPMYKEDKQKFDRYIVYYLEKQIKCSGRDAIVGVLNSYEEGAPPEHEYWAKFTLYLDNGEFGVSEGTGKSGLTFDDAKSRRPEEYDLISQLNLIFASNGKNFSSSEVWESDIPTILKDIYYPTMAVGDLLGDLSIIKKEVSTKHAVPCTEFSVNLKGGMGFGGEIVYCVTALDNKLGLPYVVSMTTPKMDMDNDFKLKKIEKESSGVSFYPQCMEPFYCAKPEMMNEQERNECQSQGRLVYEERDDKKCITAFKCLTKIESVKIQIKKGQPANCLDPSDELLQEAMKCVEGEYEPKSMELDDMGCLISVEC
ncbi:MAG: hypothetical protein ABH986_04805 [archaeon]